MDKKYAAVRETSCLMLKGTSNFDQRMRLLIMFTKKLMVFENKCSSFCLREHQTLIKEWGY